MLFCSGFPEIDCQFAVFFCVLAEAILGYPVVPAEKTVRVSKCLKDQDSNLNVCTIPIQDLCDSMSELASTSRDV